jgi:hypothetical protein
MQGACSTGRRKMGVSGAQEAQTAARNQSTAAMMATIQPQEGHTLKVVPVSLKVYTRNSITAAAM